MLDDVRPIIFLKSDRIHLRPLEVDDAALCQHWVNDPDTRETLLMYRPMNKLGERKFIENVSNQEDAVHFGIGLNESGELIGVIGLHMIRWKDRVGELGLFIGEANQRGRGLGTEAMELILEYGFSTLNLNRIQLFVFPFNETAIKLYKRLGFVHEGIQREGTFKSGRYVDHLLYGLLAREYYATRSDKAKA